MELSNLSLAVCKLNKYDRIRNRNTVQPQVSDHPEYENLLVAYDNYYGLSDPTTHQQGERRFKSEFAFFQYLSRLLLLTHFVKCTRTLPNLNSKRPYSSSESEVKFRRSLFTFPMHKTRNQTFSRRSSAKAAKKCAKNGDARTKLLFCLLKSLFFRRSRCSRVVES